MQIIKADAIHLNTVYDIVQTTIDKIYPHYYPEGAVKFFKEHHCKKNIITDISNGYVYILVTESSVAAGTVTVKNNELNRLFVSPEFQGKGFGKALLNFAEDKIFTSYDEIIISASLPSKNIYINRNYIETSYNQIATDCGDYLCYDEMRKYKKDN